MTRSVVALRNRTRVTVSIATVLYYIILYYIILYCTPHELLGTISDLIKIDLLGNYSKTARQ